MNFSSFSITGESNVHEIQRTADPPSAVSTDSDPSGSWEDFEADLSVEDLELERLVLDVEGPGDILDQYLFNEDEF